MAGVVYTQIDLAHQKKVFPHKKKGYDFLFQPIKFNSAKTAVDKFADWLTN